MSIGSIPDILAFTRLSRAVADVKARAQTARTEAVTGRYMDATKAVGGDIGGTHILRKAVEDSQAYQKTLAMAGSRLSIVQSALESVTAETARIGSNALNGLSVDGGAMIKAVAADAHGVLHTVFAALNTSTGGRALFSGDAADTPPLGPVEDMLADVAAIITAGPDAATIEAELDFYFNDPAGGFETTIYRGGAGEAPTVEVAPGARLVGAVKANAEPLKDLMRHYAVLANAEHLSEGAVAGGKAVLENAAEGLLATETTIADMRAVLGVTEARIAELKTRHEMEEVVLTSLYNARTTRDPYEAAAQVQLLESQLEKSYILSARLGNLSLANFLR